MAVVGAGFVGCKMVAKWPQRVASLTMLSTTQCGWHMAAQMMKRPWVTLKVRSCPAHELCTAQSLYTCEVWLQRLLHVWGCQQGRYIGTALACGLVWQLKYFITPDKWLALASSGRSARVETLHGAC